MPHLRVVVLMSSVLISTANAAGGWVGSSNASMYGDGPGCSQSNCSGCPALSNSDSSLGECENLCAANRTCTAIDWAADATGKTAGACITRGCHGGSLVPKMPSAGGALAYYCNGTRAECAQQPPAPHGEWPAMDRVGSVRIPIDVVASQGEVVAATVAWRRRDQLPGPDVSAFTVTCWSTGADVDRVRLIQRNRTHLQMHFSATCGTGTYLLYFLLPGSSVPLPSPCAGSPACPSGMNGGCCSPGSNATLRGFAEGGPTNKCPNTTNTPTDTPAVQVGQMEARSAFMESTEMELVASPDEVAAMVERSAGPKTVLLFPEDAAHEIRMLRYLPVRWTKTGPHQPLSVHAQPGEYVSFQIGVYALKAASNISATLLSAPQSCEFKCVSCGGVTQRGIPFAKVLGVEQGQVLPLWLGVMLPDDASPGTQQVQVAVAYSVDGVEESQSVTLTLFVSGPTMFDHGDSDMKKRTRIRWLDSTRAQDDMVTGAYTAITIKQESTGMLLEILGRQLLVSNSSCGFPASITSWGVDLLGGPVSMDLFDVNGRAWRPVPDGLELTHVSPGTVNWQARCTDTSASITMVNEFSLEADGHLNVSSSVLPTVSTSTLGNVTLRIPFRDSDEVSKYIMGFGQLGQSRPAQGLDWNWTSFLPKRNSMLWVGGGTGGMRVSLKGPESHWNLPMWYGWPSAAGGYKDRSELLPSWAGDKSTGGCGLQKADRGVVELVCYSNSVSVSTDWSANGRFHFDLLITPFQDVNRRIREKFGIRHYQLGYPNSADASWPADIKETYGSTVIGVHQGTAINPFISWIFDPAAASNASKFIQAAHEQGMRTKMYFTVRELSVRAALSELFALVSMGDEILDRRLEFPDPWEHRDNLGNSWMQAHLLNVPNASEPGYSVAYSTVMPWMPEGYKWDAAVHVKGDSRWVNWYVEALNFVMTRGLTSPPDNVTFDGLYLDGVNYDRGTMKRVRKVLDRAKPGSLVDFHCMQTMTNPYGEYGNMSVALSFMGHMPYIDNLWFGEGFDTSAGASKEHWLVEQSGMLFGVFSEMLARPNLYKGMLFGETGRAPAVNMKPLYGLWDEINIQSMWMCGWWNTSVQGCPAATDNDDVPLTTYSCANCSDSNGPAVLFSLASFASAPVNVSVVADLARLGFGGDGVVLRARAVDGFQPEAVFVLGRKIPVAPSQGWLLLLEQRS